MMHDGDPMSPGDALLILKGYLSAVIDLEVARLERRGIDAAAIATLRLRLEAERDTQLADVQAQMRRWSLAPEAPSLTLN